MPLNQNQKFLAVSPPLPAYRDDFFMSIAINEAQRACKAGEVPVGCVLVSDEGKILAAFGNETISRHDPTAHAEMLAIRHAAHTINNYRLTDAHLYVTLEPCLMCAGAILAARIKRLVYGTCDLKAGACGSIYNVLQDSRLNHLVEIRAGVLENQCKNILSEFFATKRPIKDCT